MNYSIENEYLKITVSDLGAELVSVVSKKDGCEYLWTGDGKYWGSHAPILFPFCCRSYGGYYTYSGRQYFMGCHGFARKTVYPKVKTAEDYISMTLLPADATRDAYPFNFSFNVTYKLKGDTVETLMLVRNLDDDETIYFALGGHPGFNVPLDNGSFEDWYVEFASECSPKQIIFTDTCFRTKDLADYHLEDGKIIRLNHSLFDNDAIFLQDTCGEVTLKSAKSEKSVTVKDPALTDLGFWHSPKTEAPFVCIEPMNGLPSYDGKVDDITTKADMIALKAGDSYTNAYTMTFKG